MDKKTLFAVILSVVVIVGSMLLQQVFFPTPQQPALPPVKEAPAAEARPAGAQAAPDRNGVPQAAAAGQTLPAAESAGPSAAIPQEELREETFTLETNVFRVAFSNRGAVITSIQLKNFRNADGSPVEMVMNNDSDRFPFFLYFGDTDAPPEYALFHVQRAVSEPRVEFSRQFVAPTGIPFTLRKTYLLKPNDYLMEVRVTIENSVNEFPQLDYQGKAYTIGFGPQIGPTFKTLDKRSEYRNFMYYAEGKKHDVGIPKEGIKTLEARMAWAAIVGKYFTVIGIPDATPYRVTLETRPLEGLPDRASLLFSRPPLQSSKSTDVFRFYVGPKKREILSWYNDPQKNAFGTADLHLEETVSSSPLLGWLANILKFFLELFYRVIPNYGVAILLLTLLIKIVFWPLTHKSFESTSKMQALNPKLTEIREKYKNNPQKMNQEIAALYKREGVSPLGGCLPLLLQLPIFFALYTLLNDHFELRGAGFIRGWIDDLSAPEAVVTFAEPISLLFWQLQALRVLPFVMLGTTFLQTKVSQTPGASAGQMKMMMYLMPLIFFFILYDMPSGLVLYWTMQNILSIFQQLYINSRQKKIAVAGSAGGGGAPRSSTKPRGRK